MASITTAAEMARIRGIDPKRFRAALRRAGLQWHSHNGRWEVSVGSAEHQDLVRILGSLGVAPSNRDAIRRLRDAGRPPTRISSDEAWIVDLCDSVLSKTALRQHRFPFLVGDAGKSGRNTPLPVDAYYPELALVVEYHEPQHSKPVGFFDSRPTVSGVARGEQRRDTMTCAGPCSLPMGSNWRSSTFRSSSTPPLAGSCGLSVTGPS